MGQSWEYSSETRALWRTHCRRKRSVFLTARQLTWRIQTPLTDAAICWGEEKVGANEAWWEIERSLHLEKEKKTGRDTQGLQSIRVITFPLNSCQRPSAATSLMKCSWRYEQSAWRITSQITTQKPKMLGDSPLLPHVSKQLSMLCPPCLHGHLRSVKETLITRTSINKCHTWVKVPL